MSDFDQAVSQMQQQSVDQSALLHARARLADLKLYAAKLRKLYPGNDDIGNIADAIDHLAWGPRLKES